MTLVVYQLTPMPQFKQSIRTFTSSVDAILAIADREPTSFVQSSGYILAGPILHIATATLAVRSSRWQQVKHDTGSQDPRGRSTLRTGEPLGES